MKFLLGVVFGVVSVFVILLSLNKISISFGEDIPSKVASIKVEDKKAPELTKEEKEAAAIKAVDEALRQASKTINVPNEESIPAEIELFGAGGEVDKRAKIDGKSPDTIFTVSQGTLRKLQKGDSFLSPLIHNRKIKYTVLDVSPGRNGLIQVYAGRAEDLSYMKITIGKAASSYLINIEGNTYMGRSIKSNGVLYAVTPE